MSQPHHNCEGDNMRYKPGRKGTELEAYRKFCRDKYRRSVERAGLTYKPRDTTQSTVEHINKEQEYQLVAKEISETVDRLKGGII